MLKQIPNRIQFPSSHNVQTLKLEIKDCDIRNVNYLNFQEFLDKMPNIATFYMVSCDVHYDWVPIVGATYPNLKELYMKFPYSEIHSTSNQ